MRKKIILSIFIGLFFLLPGIVQAEDVCVCRVHWRRGEIRPGSNDRPEQFYYVGIGKLNQTNYNFTGWDYYRVESYPESIKESVSGYKPPLESGLLDQAPFVEYIKTKAGIADKAINFLNDLIKTPVTVSNCSEEIDEIWEKMDDDSYGGFGTSNSVDHDGTCQIMNCESGSVYCTASHSTGGVGGKIEELVGERCKEGGEIYYAKIDEDFFLLNNDLLEVSYVAGEGGKIEKGTYYYKYKKPNGDSDTAVSSFEVITSGWLDNSSGDLVFQGVISLKSAIEKHKQGLQGSVSDFKIRSVKCTKDDARNQLFLSGQKDEKFGLPVDTKKDQSVSIEIGGPKPNNAIYLLDKTYGVEKSSNSIWTLASPEKWRSNVKIVETADSKSRGFQIEESSWAETGDYSFSFQYEIDIDHEYFGKQSFVFETSPWGINVYVDCQKRVEDKGCKESSNQSTCEQLCEKDSFCNYIGQNRCVDKNTDGATPVDKVNYYSETNYGMPDNYDGPLPKCAFSGLCRETNDLVALFVKIADFFFGIIGSVSFLFFIAGGFMMIISLGNSDRVSAGKKMMTAAITGMVIAFSAYLLVNFFLTMMGVDATFRVIK